MFLRMTTRMTEIIKLLSATNDFVTSQKIASNLNVTSRTVREDIKIINDKLKQHGVQVTSKKGQGYILTSQTKEQLTMLLNNLEEEKVTIDSQSVTPDDRVRFIIKKLLFTKKSIKLQSLVDELYVSDSTLKNDLKKAKEILAKYNIQVLKDNQGLYVKGNEVNKRFCISDYFIYKEELTNDFVIQLINNFGYSFTDQDIKQINEIILGELNSHDIMITDETLNTITIHIIIAISRIKTDQPISSVSTISDLKNETEFNIAKRINHAIETIYHIKFSEQEIAYTTLHLVGNRIGQENLLDIKVYMGEEILQLSLEILSKTSQALKGINFQNDKDLVYSLGLHLKQLTMRLKYDMNIRNPLVDKIKIKYPIAFEVGVIAARCVEKETGFKVNDHEIGFLALHFGAAIERQQAKNITRKKIALVCASGMATSSLLLTKLSYVLDESYTLIGAYPLHQLDELLDQNPDFILTTVPIDKELNIPVFSVPTILDNNDVLRIKDSLHNTDNGRKIISQFFTEKLFFSSLKTKSKEETLNYLTSTLISEGYINKDLKQSIMERERISPTSIGNLVAIPHPLKMDSNQSFMCTAILDQPVSWSVDEEVQLVIIIVLEKKWQSKFQDIFGALHDIFQSPDDVTKLCNSRNIREFSHLIDSL